MPRKTSNDSNAGKMEVQRAIPCQIGYGKYIYVYLSIFNVLSALDDEINQRQVPSMISDAHLYSRYHEVEMLKYSVTLLSGCRIKREALNGKTNSDRYHIGSYYC